MECDQELHCPADKECRSAQYQGPAQAKIWMPLGLAGATGGATVKDTRGDRLSWAVAALFCLIVDLFTVSASALEVPDVEAALKAGQELHQKFSDAQNETKSL